MALGSSSLVGSIGSMVSPYVTSFTYKTLGINPMVSVGIIVLVSGIGA